MPVTLRAEPFTFRSNGALEYNNAALFGSIVAALLESLLFKNRFKRWKQFNSGITLVTLNNDHILTHLMSRNQD